MNTVWGTHFHWDDGYFCCTMREAYYWGSNSEISFSSLYLNCSSGTSLLRSALNFASSPPLWNLGSTRPEPTINYVTVRWELLSIYICEINYTSFLPTRSLDVLVATDLEIDLRSVGGVVRGFSWVPKARGRLPLLQINRISCGPCRRLLLSIVNKISKNSNET